MTGRAAGYCAGNVTPGYTTAGPGRGYGMGRGAGGGGRGRRNMYYATGLPGWARGGTYANPYVPPAPFVEPDPELQKQALKSQADGLQAQLDLIQKRLSDLEAGSK